MPDGSFGRGGGNDSRWPSFRAELGGGFNLECGGSELGYLGHIVVDCVVSWVSVRPSYSEGKVASIWRAYFQ